MDLAMTLPTMLPHGRDELVRWCRGIDDGPWSSLAVPERITYTSHSLTVQVSAAAALTERVGIWTTLIVLPEHGRHLFMNGQNPDSYGRSGIDHGQGDDGDRDVWMLALGPDVRPGVYAPTGVPQAGRASGRYETIDATMTAMALLGHGDRMRQDLEDAGARPGLVISEVLR